MFYIVVASVVLLGLSHPLFSQEVNQQGVNQPDVNIIPPPPTEAALGKYGVIPVSKYTGVPNISIPLYELKQGSLSVPLSLSYHASGVKVEELASYVGLGWSLNAGGIITRSVVGKPDENTNGYFNNSSLLINPNLNLNGFLNNTNLSFANLFQSCSSLRDLEPDVFSFNFMGFSGTMYIDPYTNSCHITPHSDITIEFISTGYNSFNFRATDFKGIVYEFIASSTSYTNSQAVNGGDFSVGAEGEVVYCSTWYLSRIYDPNTGDEIKFNYSTVKEKYDIRKSSVYGKVICAESYSPTTNIKSFNKSQIIADTKFIDSITTNNCRVIFNYSSREDLMNLTGQKLDNLTIDNFYTNNDIYFTFNYSYFDAGSNYYDKRLRLNSLTKNTSNGEDGGTHSFDYFTGLPSRYSKQKDYWGYYNGQTANETKPYGDIPATTFLNVAYSGGILEPDETGTSTKAGTLSRITYPTGGYSLFDYEPNTYSAYYEGTTLKELDPNENNELAIVARWNYSSVEPNNYFEFELYKDMIVTFNVVKDHTLLEAKITNQNGTNSFFVCSNINSEEVQMSQGIYRLTMVNKSVEPTIDNPFTAECNIRYLIPGSLPQSKVEKTSGGIRVKSITNYSAFNEVSTITNYKYNLEDKQNWSSGVMMNSEPIYEYVSYNPRFEQGYDCLYDAVFNRTNINQSNLTLTKGSPVGYREVREVLSDNSYSISKFSITNDNYFGGGVTLGTISSNCVYSVRPFLSEPVDDRDCLRGQLLSETQYFDNGKPLKTVSYNYSSLAKYLIPGIRTGFIINTPGYYENNQDKHKMYYKTYVKTIYDTYLSSKTETFFNNVDIITVITTSYLYNIDRQVKTITKRFRERLQQGTAIPVEDVTTNIFYAKDINFTIQGAVINGEVHSEMVSRNMLSIPILSVGYKNGLITKGSFNKYDFCNGNIVPIEYYELNLDSMIYEKRFELKHSYSGKLIEQTDNTQITTAYFWSYNDEYPVAKISNLKYNELTQELKDELNAIQFHSNFNSELARNSFKSLNQSIRQKVPNVALINTYTYIPGIGITSQTDPNGITTYYEYDGLGRLIYVRDNSYNVIKKYEYNYAN